MIIYSLFQSKKTITGILFLCFFTTFSFSQDSRVQPNLFWSNVQFGGGLGLNFGNGFFNGVISPTAIYRLSPFVATGLGLNFQYSSQRDVLTSTVVGASAIGLFNPIRELQISTEFEQLYIMRNFDENFVSNANGTYWYPALFLGLGYTNGNVTFGIRYDVLYNRNRSIYNDAWIPFVRVFF